MVNPFEAIINFLSASGVSYELIEHEPVYTSEQAAKVRGFSLRQGAKALLLKADGKFILCVLPGDRRLDTKKVKSLLNIKDLRFAKPGEVISIMGCEIGACYPFGNLINVPMFIDRTLSENEIISFNPGVHTKSLKIRYNDYAKVVSPVLKDISKVK